DADAAGPIRTRDGSPASSARNASRITAGSEQAPPTQPARAPSGATIARSPRLVDAGRSTLTTVARTYGLPSADRRAASISTSSLLIIGPGPPPAAPPTPCPR